MHGPFLTEVGFVKSILKTSKLIKIIIKLKLINLFKEHNLKKKIS